MLIVFYHQTKNCRNLSKYY